MSERIQCHPPYFEFQLATFSHPQPLPLQQPTHFHELLTNPRAPTDQDDSDIPHARQFAYTLNLASPPRMCEVTGPSHPVEVLSLAELSKKYKTISTKHIAGGKGGGDEGGKEQ